MDDIFENNYSFTFTIPTFKNVYYKGNRRRFGNMTQEQQFDFLESHLHKINSFAEIKWVYEEHEDFRLHIHGYVCNTAKEPMNEFRHKFYSYPISMTEKSYLKISDIQRTTNHISYFVDYMSKHQDKIKFYMRDINREKPQPITKTVRIQTNISPAYFNSLSTHLEDVDSGDTYPFGKKNIKNNHIVEF